MSLTKVTYSMIQGAPVNASDYPTLQAAVTFAESTNSLVVVNDVFTVSDVQLNESKMGGSGTLIANTGSTSVLLLGTTNLSNNWRYRNIDNIYIDGNVKASNGVTFAGSTNEIAGRWALKNVALKSCDIAIHKPYGNIGNSFINLSVNGCNYGYRAVSNVSPVMHAGSDRFIGGEFSSCMLAAIYIDSPNTDTGQTIIDGTVIEGCPGFGIFVKSYAVGFVPLVIRNVWFELNATEPSVVIDGVAQAPYDILLNNADNVIIEQSPIVKARFINSSVVIDQCVLSNYTQVSITNSSVIVTNALLDAYGINGSSANLQIQSVATIRRAAGSFAATFWAAPRTTLTKVPVNNGTLLAGESFDGVSAINFSSLVSTQLSNVHPLFEYCARYDQPAGNTSAAYSFTAPANSYFVFTLDFGQISGDTPLISIAAAQVLFPTVTCLSSDGSLRTIAGICFTENSSIGAALNIVNDSANISSWVISSFQVVQFSNMTDAISYFNSKTYSLA